MPRWSMVNEWEGEGELSGEMSVVSKVAAAVCLPSNRFAPDAHRASR